MQSCTSLGVSDAIPTARTLAQSSQSLPLRMAAMAAIGKFGGTQDIELLQSILSSPQTELYPAAQSALSALSPAEPSSPPSATQPSE